MVDLPLTQFTTATSQCRMTVSQHDRAVWGHQTECPTATGNPARPLYRRVLYHRHQLGTLSVRLLVDQPPLYVRAGRAATSSRNLQRRRAGWTGSLRSRTGAFLPRHALYERTWGTMRATFISVWLLTLYDI